MRYTKKPVTIEAVRFMGLTDFGDPQFDVADGMPDWLMEAMAAPEGEPGSAFVGRNYAIEPINRFIITTLEGSHVASAGDWIIKGIKGELYPCKADIFEATYDAGSAPEQSEVTAAKEGAIAVDGETPGVFLKRVGYDGKLWAEAFVQQFEGKSIGHDASSHGVDDMLGWFANAIMAGYDAGRIQGWKEDAPYGHERAAPGCSKLEALDASGREAISALNPDDDIEAALEDGQSFVIGEGFRSA